MTVEEILAALQEILDASEGRTLTEDEATRYEDLERQLQAAQRTDQIRARNAAYNAPMPGAHLTHVAPAPTDDGLETAFEAYLRTGQANADISGLAVNGGGPTFRNDQGVGTGAGGGYLVPPAFRTKIVEVMKAFGGLAAAVDSFDTDTGAPLEYPSLDDTANSGQISADATAPTSGADLTFGTVKLGAYDYTSAGASGNPLRVPWTLLQDAAFDLVGMLTRQMGIRIARKQAADWCTGTGVSQPLGIVAASLTADETLDVSNVIDYDDLLDTEDHLDPSYEQNASWVMNKNAWTNIRGIVDGSQRPVIMPEALSGIGGRPEKVLLGYPVIIDQGMPTMTGSGAFFAVLGDLREAYVIRRISQLAVIVNPWTRANQRETEFTAWQRADGTIQNRSAYVILRNI